jgi:hypothetical protein
MEDLLRQVVWLLVAVDTARVFATGQDAQGYVGTLGILDDGPDTPL